MPDDIVTAEEHQSFATRIGVPLDQMHAHNLIVEQRSFEELVSGYTAVFVGGSGNYSVLDDLQWVKDYIDILGNIASSDTPMFSSCFGFQGLVLALGGEVKPEEPRSEVGTYRMTLRPEAADDDVFSQLPHVFDAQQGHKDSATRLPSGVTHLVSSERCEYQALRVTGKRVYATQFHPELTGADNQARFLRYYDMYKKVFNEERADEILHGHRESPDSNSLLAHFAEALQRDQEA
ncbi:MAG: GMP synthase (glutamine-hydrolyzing) [Bradymonadia bacterium]|jgi:GMP synthase (glutamine-hydrolysing)